MELINSQILKDIVDKDKLNATGLLPELVKRLILSSVSKISQIRFPCGDDIWAPGFDGVVECDEGTSHIKSGYSVWECGINHNSLSKVNHDYKARTDNSLGVDKRNTAFYMVVPYIWNHKICIQRWEKERNGEWASIHIVDASELCDWINSEPAVLCWLFEKYSGRALSFYSMARAWDRFSSKTSPNFVQDLFVNGRNAHASKLSNCENNSVIRIKSQSHIDAVGFALSVIMSNKEYAETYIAVDNINTYFELNKYVKNKTFVFTFKHEGDLLLENNNRVILCFSCEDTSVKPDIDLNKLSHSFFESALEKMGIKGITVSRLCKFTDRNPYVLLRHIPGTANETHPKWARGRNLSLLIPMLFLRQVNKSSEPHKLLIEMLGFSYQDVETKMRELLKYEDSPIKVAGPYLSIINYEEVWNELNLSVTDQCYAKLIDTIKYLISSYKQDNALINSIGGIVFDNLLMNLIYFSNNSDTDRRRVGNDITYLISLMEEMDCHYLLFKNLTTLSKASPTAVLSYIEKDLKRENSLIDSLFLNQTSLNEHCHILWAIECLLQFEATKIEACKILKELYMRKYEYKNSNSAQETLLSALFIFTSFNALTLNEKKGLLNQFIDDDPIEMSIFALKLLSNNQFAHSVSIEEYLHDVVAEEITWGDIFSVMEEVCSRIMQVILDKKSAVLLGEFVKAYQVIKPEIMDVLAENIKREGFDGEKLNNVYYNVLETIRLIKMAAKFHKKNGEKYVQVLKNLADKIQDNDAFLKYSLFFKSWWSCPIVFLSDDDDYDAEESKKLEFRKNIYLELKNEYGQEIVYKLLAGMDDSYNWGSFLFEMETPESIKSICNKCVDISKFTICASILSRLTLDDFNLVFSSIEKEIQPKILPYVYRNDILHVLDNEENCRAYWGTKRMIVFDEVTYDNLLKYNPIGIVSYFYSKEINGENLRYIINACKQVLEEDITHIWQNIDEYYFTGIFEKIDSYIYLDEIAEMEFEFYRKKLIRDYTEGMKTFLFLRPFEVVNVFNNDTAEKLGLELWFSYNFSLPKMAYSDLDKFLFFFDTIIEKSHNRNQALSFAGQVLGRTINGSDKIFPHEYARHVIEKHKNDKLGNGFVVGKMNSIGMRSVGDGSDQLIIAQKYSQDANAIRIMYPYTASLLDKLSSNHKHDAEEDKIDSEIYFY